MFNYLAMAPIDPDDIRMSLGDHLEELRTRLFWGLIGPVVAAIVLMFFAHDPIIPFLCIPLLQAMEAVGQSPALYFLHVGDAFGAYLRVSLIGGVIIGIPWLIWHLWRFITPGLYPHERRFVTALLPGSAALAVVGVVFMYYVMLPFTLWFLVGFATAFPMPVLGDTPITRFFPSPETGVVEGGNLPANPLNLPKLAENPAELVEGDVWIKVPENQIRIVLGGTVRQVPLRTSSLLSPQLTLKEYISFVMWMALAFAVAFQLPLVMLAIGVTGLVGYEAMAGARKFALLGCFIIGAILTPADPLSMFALAIPLYVLYEFGLILVKTFATRSPADAEDEE